MADLRLGLIGIGMMGRHHARVITETDGVVLAGVVDEAGDPRRAAGDAPLFDSLEALIAAGIDAAVVSVPTHAHEQIALQLASAGIHALVEKPLTADSESGRRVADAFARAGLVGAVGHIERYNPALRSLRDRVDSGELGDVYQIATRRQGPFPSRIADVGVVKDLATHDIDATAWLAQSRFGTVTAHTASRSGRPHEDLVSATAQLESGIITNHLVNWLSPMKERVTVVTGERGALVADTVSADLTFFENGTFSLDWESVMAFRGVSEGTVTRFALNKREPLRVEHEAFRDAILGVGSDIVTMTEGVENVRVAEALLRSAALGVSVKVDR
ncbi:Gfo/Idh/MocA family oxidoreductase [Leifsonia shinshuensis]|uniref:Gfo/Idh/MocA family protein n=1 Tax=Leifsonia shinshuensis TaxID=150026 RepID=UPI001F506294|nr:Gfo/Idh/MocA family oxidoreductase [Leifsonia shinshuensis]MCI0158209.1 Gfo/Idh/MocA family oxidoreductase [Leifsonia shinshuensis]